jgi:hypothetical protein
MIYVKQRVRRDVQDTGNHEDTEKAPTAGKKGSVRVTHPCNSRRGSKQKSQLLSNTGPEMFAK